MRAVIRETAQQQLQPIIALVDLYQRGDPAFVDAVIGFFRQAENALAQLRLPEASALATRRGLILAARDGYRPDDVNDGPKRKAVRAITMRLLAEAEQELREVVGRQDAWLAEMNEKMVQLVAVGMSEGVIPMPPSQPRARWVAGVWKALGKANGRAMHAYLSAALQASDRHHLLEQALERLESGA